MEDMFHEMVKKNGESEKNLIKDNDVLRQNWEKFSDDKSLEKMKSAQDEANLEAKSVIQTENTNKLMVLQSNLEKQEAYKVVVQKCYENGRKRLKKTLKRIKIGLFRPKMT